MLSPCNHRMFFRQCLSSPHKEEKWRSLTHTALSPIPSDLGVLFHEAGKIWTQVLPVQEKLHKSFANLVLSRRLGRSSRHPQPGWCPPMMSVTIWCCWSGPDWRTVESSPPAPQNSNCFSVYLARRKSLSLMKTTTTTTFNYGPD